MGTRQAGNPKNIVGIESKYTYQGPDIPFIFALYSWGSLFGETLNPKPHSSPTTCEPDQVVGVALKQAKAAFFLKGRDEKV